MLVLGAVLNVVASQSGLPEIRRPMAALLDGVEAGNYDTPFGEVTTTGPSPQSGPWPWAGPTRPGPPPCCGGSAPSRVCLSRRPSSRR